MKILTRKLFWKFFLSYFAVVMLSLIVLGGIIRILLPEVFDNHLFRMGALLSQHGLEGGMPMMRRVGRQMNGAGLFQDLFEIVNQIILESTLYAFIPSLVVALVASGFMSQFIVKPVEEMAEAADRIAEGHYHERLPISARSPDRRDEITLLAERFNRMTAKLEKTEETRRRLIGDVAHELRTPLTVISGSMEGLMDGVLDPDRESFERIYRQAVRLERLVDDLQELHTLETDEFQLNIQSLDLVAFLENIVKTMKFSFDEQDVRLVFEHPENDIHVMADVDRLAQIMINLLSNALRYTAEGGMVGISLDQNLKTGHAVISVSDTGIGIPESDLLQVFDRFYRVDGSRSRSDGGSGIGLTITKRLVQAQNGKIWVESEGQGKGATFSFTLPID